MSKKISQIRMVSASGRLGIVLFLLASLLVLTPPAPARAAGVVWYVKPAATGAADCSSWVDACELQSALGGASSGDEIWVMAGTYTPTGGADRTISFQLVNAVALYGGFAGAEIARSQRDPEANLTILSGEIGDPGYADNSLHVLVSFANNSETRLDGFTITDGNADSPDGGRAYDGYGGGMYNTGGGSTLVNITFSGNSADYGGGMYKTGTGTLVTLIDITFSGNYANYGGGMYNRGDNLILKNATFNDNSASNGGGMYIRNGAPSLNNVTISENHASSNGGGIFIDYNSRPTLMNITFYYNSANDGGGGIYLNEMSFPRLTNVVAVLSELGRFCLKPSTSDSSRISSLSSYNLIDDGMYSCGIEQGVNGNRFDFAILSELGDYGGLTQTHALLTGSKGINEGTNTGCPTTDQRGAIRPFDGVCDIGAFEYGSIFAPIVTTGAVTAITATGATLNGTVNANGDSTAVTFEYGLNTAYGSTAAADPSPLTGMTDTAVSGTLIGLLPSTTYHFRAVGVNINGTTHGLDASFTTTCASAITVTNANAGGPGSLTQAILSLCPAGTITFDGSYTIPIDGLTPAKSLTIDGSGHTVTLLGGLLINAGETTVLNGLALSGQGPGGGSTPGIINRGTLAINRCTVSNYWAPLDPAHLVYPGAIYNSGMLTINQSTLSDNHADEHGGAIYNSGTVSLQQSTLVRNHAQYSGGAIYNAPSATLTIVRSTLGQNIATLFGGGAINNAGQLSLINSTIAENTAPFGGGGLYLDGATELLNTAIAENSPDQMAEFSSVYHSSTNLIQNALCGAACDPLLAPLGDYGGPTQTYALLPGSAAINAATPTYCTAWSDQRDVNYVDTCDIGAFESQGFSLAINRGNNQSASINTAFANPLEVRVTANAPAEPVDGGQVTFTPPASGASASLTSSLATITGGASRVTATANGTAGGPYPVTASASGAASLDFSLTNLAAVPILTWAAPANIAGGTPLGPVQLNATANVAGSFVYTPDVGVILPVGSHTLHVDFTPADSNYTDASEEVTLVVTDGAAPVLTVPADITAEASGLSGAAVTFSVSALDDVDGALTPSCDAVSGSTFPFGLTTVTCEATDAAGNTASASFTITVVDTTAPLVTVPADITAEAAGPGGAVVTFSASALDAVDGALTPACAPASGSTFPLGATTILCEATDSEGNTGSASFDITVADTTAPTVSITGAPADPTNLTSASFTFTTAGDPVSIECDLDGGGFGACETGASQVYPGPLSVGTHTFTVQAADAFNNASVDTHTWTIDTAALTVAVEQAAGQADPTNLGPLRFTATFNKPIVLTSFNLDDLILSGTAPGPLAATLDEIAPNDGTTFEVSISGMSGPGTVSVAVAEKAVQDNAGNPNSASTSLDNQITYDTVKPAVSSLDLDVKYIGNGPRSFSLIFNKAVFDPAGSLETDDVTNPNNYLLFEKGANKTADTLSCRGGLLGDDAKIAISSVSYDEATFESTVSLFSPLPVGSYKVLICGTTSIVDLAGNALNGGSDYPFDFVVAKTPTILPATGFTPGRVTILPEQPAGIAYAETGLVLEIPSLGVKMNITGVPQVETSWDVTWLGNDAGWLDGSAFPTWAGNTVLTGHVWDSLNRPGPFAQLRTLNYGDQFYIHAFGMTYTYEVRESRLVIADNVALVMQPEELDWVTLVTCETFNARENNYVFRRMVRAVLVCIE